MATDYGADSVWGSDWKKAQAAGNTALMQKYQTAIDARPQAAQQVGMITAKTLDQGRGSTDVWANGGNGLEYNTVGQSRTPGTTTISGGKSVWATQPGAPQGTPVGNPLDPTPTMTQAQYGSTPAGGGAAFPPGSNPITGGAGPAAPGVAKTSTNDKGGMISLGGTGPTVPGADLTTPITTPATNGTGGTVSFTPAPTTGGGTVPGTGVTNPGTSVVTNPGTGGTTTGGGMVTTSTGDVTQALPGHAVQTPWNVTSDQTVRGQLAKAYNPNDPLQVMAKTEALQNMNERGLLNSSIAETAGQQAMLDVALPIAQADANTYATSAQSNATQANEISISNAQLQSQASITNATLGNQRWVAQLDATTKTNLANIEQQYKKQIQASASASQMWTSTLAALTSIMQSDLDNSTPLTGADGKPILDSAGNPLTAKGSAMQQIVATLATGLQVQGTLAGVDFGNLLNFG